MTVVCSTRYFVILVTYPHPLSYDANQSYELTNYQDAWCQRTCPSPICHSTFTKFMEDWGYRGAPWKRQGGEDSTVVSACYRIIPGFDMNNKQNKPGSPNLPGLLFSLLLNDIFCIVITISLYYFACWFHTVGSEKMKKVCYVKKS